MNRRKEKDTINYTYLKLFLVFVFLSIFVSLLLRLVNSVIESRFDYRYFNILIVGKKTYAVNIKKDENSVFVMEVVGDSKINFKNTPKEKINVKFQIPFDAVFIDKREPLFEDPKKFFSFGNIMSYILSPGSFEADGINKFDLLKIYFATYSVSLFDVKSAVYDLAKAEEMDSQLFEYFKDKNIINEKLSVEIVNASGINGAGSEVQKMLETSGFDVISTRSSDEQENNSRVVCGIDKNYSINRLERIFSINMDCKKETGIADVSIVIGKDGRFVDSE